MDHVHTLGLEAVLGDHLLAGVLRVHDEGVDPGEGGGGKRCALALERVVNRQHRWARRKQPQVQSRDREPLEVNDIGRAGASVGEHVQRVLGALAERAQPRAGGAERVAVEALVAHVALGDRSIAVGKAAGQQAHVGAEPRQRRGERVVIGR